MADEEEVISHAQLCSRPTTEARTLLSTQQVPNGEEQQEQEEGMEAEPSEMQDDEQGGDGDELQDGGDAGDDGDGQGEQVRHMGLQRAHMEPWTMPMHRHATPCTR